MQSFQQQADLWPRFRPLLLCSVTLLATVCALPASANPVTGRHSLSLKPLLHAAETGPAKTLRSRTTTRWTEACPGPLDMVHATPVCDGYQQTYTRTGSLLPGRRGGNIALPTPNQSQAGPLDRQASTWQYTWHKASASYTLGLLDTTSFIDAGDAEDDEGELFYAAPLVSNPTIPFPDEALGGGLYLQGQANHPNVYLALTSSHGLGDNPEASFGELLNVTGDGKGVFATAQLEWTGRARYHLGAWTNTASNPNLDGAGRKANYGLYGAAYGKSNKTRWRLRAGIADGQVATAAWFLSAAIDRDLGLVTASLGTAVTGLSGEPGAGTANTWVSELSLVHDVNGSIYISPHLQYQRNSGSDDTGTRGEWIASLQSNMVF